MMPGRAATGLDADLTARVDDVVGVHDGGGSHAETWGRQFDLGLAWVGHPIGAGGLARNPDVQASVAQELAARGVPQPLKVNLIGVGLAAPTLVPHGTHDQQQRFLRPCFTAQEIWCQLFSEAGAGSDLANLSTRATREGDGWRLDGAKMWTSYAHQARWGLALARTDADVPKHRGITCFVVDMDAPGVEVRGIRQINGYVRVNEVFLNGVAIPDEDRVGSVGDGWGVALTALASERAALSSRAELPRGAGPIAVATELWSRTEDRDPVTADRLASLWLRAELVRLGGLRAEAAADAMAPSPGVAVGKLVAAELEQEIYELCMDLLGDEALEYPGYDRTSLADLPTEYDDPRSAYLSSKRRTIAGGTSEVLRNVLGERVLGLPPEPRVDKGVAWRETRRS